MPASCDATLTALTARTQVGGHPAEESFARFTVMKLCTLAVTILGVDSMPTSLVETSYRPRITIS